MADVSGAEGKDSDYGLADEQLEAKNRTASLGRYGGGLTGKIGMLGEWWYEHV